MDRGDATLDAFYPAYQDELDSLMKAKGWQMPSSWTSRVFPGAVHTETDWAARLATPLQFLMGNRKLRLWKSRTGVLVDWHEESSSATDDLWQ